MRLLEKYWTKLHKFVCSTDMESGMSVKLGGLDVEFPYKPYGIQRAMMARIIVAYTNKQHCLIESPTGTGKSLSLICSSLAWQQKSKNDGRPFTSANFNQREMEKKMASLQDKPCSCGARPDKAVLDELKEAKGKGKEMGKVCKVDDDDGSSLKKMKISEDLSSPYFKKESIKKDDDPEFIIIDSDDDDKNDSTQIVYSKESPKSNGVVKGDNEIEIIDIGDEDFRKPLSSSETNKKQHQQQRGENGANGLCKNCLAIKTEEDYFNEMGPVAARTSAVKRTRIFYGTRTHKQIAQIVRELKKTSYTRDLRMNILSSRDRTCIHEEVKDRVDRNDRCQELIKNKSKLSGPRAKSSNIETCLYYRDSNQMAADFESIYKEEISTFDIEDAVTFGMKFGLCPYYGTRALQDNADITFCPYNYILDPNIRSALNINLKNSILILDEAHNIEDICRDSASFVISTIQIDEILTSINRAAFNYLQGSVVRDAYDFFRNLFSDLKMFLVKYQFPFDSNVKDGDCLARKVMLHQEMMNNLAMIHLGPNEIQTIREFLKALRGDDEDSSEKSGGKSDDQQDSGALSNNELQTITQLTNTLEFIYADKNKFATDFRCIVSKHLDRPKPGARNNNRIADGDVHIFQFSLMCMNSGIAFQKIHKDCWSVVVASGTLSPIDSLKTELGCVFDQVFEGSHVISDDRIFATILSHGPNGIDLNCSYNNSLRLDFQDELGQVVRDVCRTIPSGILIFFPSYDRMENLYQRWFTKGYISDIQAAGKKIHREQKNFTPNKFEEELKKYHRGATGRGAVMMAVYRGKISEGIDFSDSAARAVISIGIPYPNVKEITIGLKREYNNLARRTRPELMDGATWYQTQAMRALNQSLGRVIRHKEDWGAIIMLDSRLRSSQCTNGISKWVRRCIQMPPSYDIFRSCIEEFVARREGRLAIQED